MKIINKNWQRKIEIEENTIYTLVFENKKYYRQNITELISQHKGNEGEISDRGFYLDFHPVKIQPIPSGELGFDFGFKYSEELC